MRETCKIERLTPETLENHVTDLGAILNACVHGGAGVSFVLPHTLQDSVLFWRNSVGPALESGGRIVLLAFVDGQAAGSVQLDCDTPPNQPHRGEVTKLLVHPDFRRRGVARKLMLAVERCARADERTLLTLDTASEAAEALYASLGYQRVGVIPDYAVHATEDRMESTTIMFKRLGPMPAHGCA